MIKMAADMMATMKPEDIARWVRHSCWRPLPCPLCLLSLSPVHGNNLAALQHCLLSVAVGCLAGPCAAGVAVLFAEPRAVGVAVCCPAA